MWTYCQTAGIRAVKALASCRLCACAQKHSAIAQSDRPRIPVTPCRGWLGTVSELIDFRCANLRDCYDFIDVTLACGDE